MIEALIKGIDIKEFKKIISSPWFEEKYRKVRKNMTALEDFKTDLFNASGRMISILEVI